MDDSPWLLYYYCLYGKNRCKIGNNTIIWKTLIAMGLKLFWNFILKKLHIMIVTDLCAFVYA